MGQPMTHQHIAYLNNAASAWPKAPGVAAAVADGLSRIPEHPGRIASAEGSPLDECRRRLAGMLGVVSPDRIVLTQHATHALNLAILGLGLKRGDVVVTTVTEHNSTLRPLARLEDVAGIRLIVIGITPDGALDEDAYDQALRHSPRLVAVNHVSNVTGRIQSVSTLFARAHRVGATTLLDASQSMGHLPVDARKLNADLIAFTGHKGLRGPGGTGGLYVAPTLELEQVIVGGTGVRSDLRLHPSEMPMRLESGTPNAPNMSGLVAALRWHEEQGQAFRTTEKIRSEQLRAGLSEIQGVTLFGETASEQGIGITSLRVAGWDVEEFGYAIAESFGVICRTGLHCAPLIHAGLGCAPQGTVRFSPSGATSEVEIERALNAVRRLAS